MGAVKRAAAVLLLLLAGCSSFDRDFEAAGAASADPLVGRWEGSWTSDDTGHTGDLRCLITKEGAGEYSARYHATYGFCIITFTFEYTLPTTAVALDQAWTLRGSALLRNWIAGGLYEYEARVEGDEYVASYRASFDRGIFRMKRVR
jgi:hypothetical protein